MGTVFNASPRKPVKQLSNYQTQYPIVCLMLDSMVYIAFIKHATSVEVLSEHRSLHYSLSASLENIVTETLLQMSLLLDTETFQLSCNFSDDVLEVNKKNIEPAVLTACEKMMRLEKVATDVKLVKHPYKDYNVFSMHL